MNTTEGIKMKKFGFATIVASGLAAAVLGLAGPAHAAPANTPSTTTTTQDESGKTTVKTKKEPPPEVHIALIGILVG
jgi:hypothetical protein